MDYCNNCSKYAQGNYQSNLDYSNTTQSAGTGDYKELAEQGKVDSFF